VVDTIMRPFTADGTAVIGIEPFHGSTHVSLCSSRDCGYWI